MPTSVPLTTKNPGDVLTSSLWNAQLKQNIDKLLNTGHRTLTVAQFAALTGLEGTKGTVAGDEVYLEVDATNGILWHLVYESTETTYKWRYLGGPPMVSSVATTEATSTSGSWQDLTTVGPQIPTPRAGDYVAKTSVNIGSGGGVYSVQTGVAQGAGVPSSSTNNTFSSTFALTAVGHAYPASDANLVGVAATTNLRLRYQISAATATTFGSRRIEILPNRLI